MAALYKNVYIYRTLKYEKMQEEKTQKIQVMKDLIKIRVFKMHIKAGFRHIRSSFQNVLMNSGNTILELW